MQSSSPVVARALAALTVLILLSTACGGDDEVGPLEATGTSSEPPATEATTGVVERVPLRLTFDGESCTYDGPTELTPGPVELVFLNEAEGNAAVKVVSLAEGYTIQDVSDLFGTEPATGSAPPWQRELVWKVGSNGAGVPRDLWM